MKAIRFGIVALLALLGCASEGGDQSGSIETADQGDKNRTAEDGEGHGGYTPLERGLVLRVVSGDGEVFPPEVILPSKEAVFIRLLGTVTEADIVDADYFFQVVDLDGNLMSSDELECRRFHVNSNGRIDLVYPAIDSSGTPCGHRFGIADNLLPVPQLVPFADAPVDDFGVMHFVVEIAPADSSMLPDDTMSAAFAVQAAPNPKCGDGNLDDHEECDDRNNIDGDGCSASCRAEC